MNLRTRRASDEAVSATFPPRARDTTRELTLFAGAFAAYNVVRGLAQGGSSLAIAHGQALVRLERSRHLLFEPALQSHALRHHWIITAANWLYLYGHFVFFLSLLVWVFLRRRRQYPVVRNAFLVAMGLALVVYAVFPVAPPRLLPDEGFTDTLRLYAGIDERQGPLGGIVNIYAAVPSMHVAFSVMAAAFAVGLAPRRPVAVAWSLYPVAMSYAVIATGNHLWFDVGTGVVVAGMSMGAALFIAHGRTPDRMTRQRERGRWPVPSFNHQR